MPRAIALDLVPIGTSDDLDALLTVELDQHLVTAVLVETANPEAWFIAGSSLADHGLSAYWIDVKITAGTNVKSDTTAFIKAAHDGMRRLLGTVHDESYVLVHAVDGHSYGFGGRTQEGRWAAANPG